MAARPWARADDGLVVTVRVTPRGGRDAFDGLRVNAAGKAFLAVRVSAAASEGAANAAVCQLLARALGVAKGAVCVLSGAKAREKRLMVRGDPDRLAVVLEEKAQ